MEIYKSENLCNKLSNVLDLIRPIAEQDFGQVNEDVEGLFLLCSCNALKADLYQCRLSVAGDYVESKSGLKHVSGMTFTGPKVEILDWVKRTVPIFISSVKAMENS
jgi:hypothetical protein